MAEQFQLRNQERFEAAVRRFDEENGRDPNLEQSDGITYPREVLYAKRLTDWLVRLCPTASEELRLAARSQHLCRWTVPRSSYPMTRTGYLRWREDLKQLHAKKAAEILQEVGYGEETIARVRALNLKQDLARDRETQALEDALCLVFLEYQLADLVRKSSEEKVINALQKAWKKMTPAGQSFALEIFYGPREKALLERALEGGV